MVLFRGSSTRLKHWLFTLRAARSDDAKLASGWGPAFAGWDWLPTEFRWRVLRRSARPSPWAAHGATELLSGEQESQTGKETR